MTKVFAEYSQYYDLLYADKDYAGEAQYVAAKLRSFQTGVRRLIEFGSGTGRHGRYLARLGFDVAGIERSSEMLALSDDSAKREPSVEPGRFQTTLGDVRDKRVAGVFDAAISLFHVVSYQTSNSDVLSMFGNVARHLMENGLFLFDVWYAPAVLTMQPETRVKEIANGEMTVTRIAVPVMRTDENCVDVNFEIFIEKRASGTIHRFQEKHPMRYFSTPEINWIAMLSGFEVLNVEEWLTRKPPSTGTWGVCYLLRKKSL